MEDEIATALHTKLLKRVGTALGGCISSGNVYETDRGKVFVKVNDRDGSDVMFKGEYESLVDLRKWGFPVPRPFCAGGGYLAVEYVELGALRRFMPDLGTELGKLHKGTMGVTQGRFGFGTATCCGFLPLCNDWEEDWVSFYVRHRLEACVSQLLSETGDRELGEKWSELQVHIAKFFTGIEVQPSLLHGDLWSGNVGETENGPIAFDPASFYGHSEFDLAIGKMFGGFTKQFLENYHKIMPKLPGFDERQDIYLLFHHLNHWRHFGKTYRKSTLSLMSKIIQSPFIK